MASITVWHRLEPRARSSDMSESLAARIHDPLWMMARQWQMGEFEGEDAGSAVVARVKGVSMPLTRIRSGAAGDTRRIDHRVPLEVEVEQADSRLAAPTVLDAAEAGLVWIRMLNEQNLGHLAAVYVAHAPFNAETSNLADIDAQTLALLQVLSGRTLDGARLHSELSNSLRRNVTGVPDLPAAPAVGADHDAVIALAVRWLQWWDDFMSTSPSGEQAWNPSSLDYEFAVAAPTETGEIVLKANEYKGGRLDWYSFDLDTADSLGAAEERDQIEASEHTLTPTEVILPGSANSRFWEFENGLVDYARFDAGIEDIARMIHAEFGLLFGDDWLHIPLDMKAGTFFRTDNFEVVDTFGTVTRITAVPRAGDGPDSWGMFQHTTTGDSSSAGEMSNVFFLAPVLAGSLEGAALEEVLLVRDEMANHAWAIERLIESRSGKPIDQSLGYQQRQRELASTQATVSDTERYQMLGRVPDYWIPFMPVKRDDTAGRSVVLQRGSVRDPISGILRRPKGQLLRPTEPYFLNEEEASRTGQRIIRRYRYCRSVNGESWLWSGNRVSSGHGEVSSGLAYDQLTRAADTTR